MCGQWRNWDKRLSCASMFCPCEILLRVQLTRCTMVLISSIWCPGLLPRTVCPTLLCKLCKKMAWYKSFLKSTFIRLSHEWSRSGDRNVRLWAASFHQALTGWCLDEWVAWRLVVPLLECSQECFHMVSIHASGISIPLSLLMLLGWRQIWITSLTRQVCQCGSRSMCLTSFQLGPCLVALSCSTTAEVWQWARCMSLSWHLFILSCIGLPVSPLFWQHRTHRKVTKTT